MAEIVNLRRARKQRAAAQADAAAAANRLTFGVSKSERNKAKAERALVERRLDGHRGEKDANDA